MSAITLNAKASTTFAAKLAHTQALLQQAALEFARDAGATSPALTLACSLGAEDMVLAHLVNALAIDADIFVLETGMLHTQTLALLAQLQATSTAPVKVYRPDAQAAAGFVAREGEKAMYNSIELRKACCQIRKMEPLERALTGKKAWITGLRREQSGTRAAVPDLDRSDAKRAKLNPLADWTWGDVWHYIASNAVAYNPLHDEFYPSIGCAPCTRAIAMGEDFRAGRWWWESEAAKECGLHVSPHSSLAPTQANFAASEVKGGTPGRSQNSELKECGLHVGKTQQSESSALAVPAQANLLAEQVKGGTPGRSQSEVAQAHVAAGDVKPEGRAEAKTLNKEAA